MRTATVKVGEHLALFDGKVFVSTDESIANLLNSAFQAYRNGAHLWDYGYYPDELKGVAEDCAKHYGGELVFCDPMDYSQFPEGAIF
jgi:hypothetical protein